ncbi:MAG: hypothetical protein PHI66_01905 [Candidatus Pacebacteria bacterium]|nr:hypothetical protein [Candidatus Paceibacterota bacterium]
MISKRSLLKLKRLKRVFSVFVSITLFFGMFYYVFLMTEIRDEDVDGYENLKADSHQKYKDDISDTKSGINNLLENTQIEKITVFDGFFDDMDYEGKENPFVNLFNF